MRPARRYRYAEYYKIKRTAQTDGSFREEAEYIGPLLQARHSAQEYRSVRMFAVAVSLLTAAAGICLLIIPGFSVYKDGLYVFVPAAAALLPELYLVLGAFRLPADDRTLQADTRTFAHQRIMRSSIGVLVLYCAALLLTLIFFVTKQVRPVLLDVIYLILTAGPPILTCLLFRKMKKLDYAE